MKRQEEILNYEPLFNEYNLSYSKRFQCLEFIKDIAETAGHLMAVQRAVKRTITGDMDLPEEFADEFVGLILDRTAEDIGKRIDDAERRLDEWMKQGMSKEEAVIAGLIDLIK